MEDESSETPEYETAAPKKPRTEAQKKATENMLMKLREKRKAADEALEKEKARKEQEKAEHKSRIHETARDIRRAEVKPGGRPFQLKPAGRPIIDYDEIANRVASRLKPVTKKPKKKVVVEVTDSDSDESDTSVEEVVVKKTKAPRAKAPRNVQQEPQHEPQQPVYRGSGDRVLDALYFSRGY